MVPRAPHTIVVLSLLTLSALGCEHPDNPLFPEHRDQSTSSAEREIVVVSRTDEIPTYPCVEQCHVDREANATVRPMREFHTTIRIEHAEVMGFCDRCHDLENPDHFRLIDGTEVAFDDSALVCGQCHGEKHRDWADGIHGIQTGSWRDTAERRTCTACHDPHAPLSGIQLTALPVPENAREE
jgi:hypothetical protein